MLKNMQFYNSLFFSFLNYRTKKLFAAAGLRTDQVENDASGIWDQKLEDELKTIANPKLAVPKADGSIKGTYSIFIFYAFVLIKYIHTDSDILCVTSSYYELRKKKDAKW